MSIVDEYNKNIPDYYPAMYLDGFTPEQIRYALQRKMISQNEDSQDVGQIRIVSEVRVK